MYFLAERCDKKESDALNKKGRKRLRVWKGNPEPLAFPYTGSIFDILVVHSSGKPWK